MRCKAWCCRKAKSVHRTTRPQAKRSSSQKRQRSTAPRWSWPSAATGTLSEVATGSHASLHSLGKRPPLGIMPCGAPAVILRKTIGLRRPRRRRSPTSCAARTRGRSILVACDLSRTTAVKRNAASSTSARLAFPVWLMRPSTKREAKRSAEKFLLFDRDDSRHGVIQTG